MTTKNIYKLDENVINEINNEIAYIVNCYHLDPIEDDVSFDSDNTHSVSFFLPNMKHYFYNQVIRIDHYGNEETIINLYSLENVIRIVFNYEKDEMYFERSKRYKNKKVKTISLKRLKKELKTFERFVYSNWKLTEDLLRERNESRVKSYV